MHIYKFHNSQGFGKVPKYLRSRHKSESHDIEKESTEDKKKKPPLRYVMEEEREEMLKVGSPVKLDFNELHL